MLTTGTEVEDIDLIITQMDMEEVMEVIMVVVMEAGEAMIR